MKKITFLIIFLASLLPMLVLSTILQNRLPLNSSPGLIKRLITYLSSNTAKTTDHSVFPELRTPFYNEEPDTLFKIVEKSVKELGWQIKESNPAAQRLHAIITTRMFHFKDDIRVTVFPSDKGASLSIFSGSRKGRADFGTNTRHILDLLAKIEQQRH